MSVPRNKGESTEEWRIRNNSYVKAYYARGRKYANRAYARWTADEKRLVCTSDLTDRELAIQLGRSLQAIQDMRHQCIDKDKVSKDVKRGQKYVEES